MHGNHIHTYSFVPWLLFLHVHHTWTLVTFWRDDVFAMHQLTGMKMLQQYETSIREPFLLVSFHMFLLVRKAFTWLEPRRNINLWTWALEVRTLFYDNLNIIYYRKHASWLNDKVVMSSNFLEKMFIPLVRNFNHYTSHLMESWNFNNSYILSQRSFLLTRTILRTILFSIRESFFKILRKLHRVNTTSLDLISRLLYNTTHIA
jgi:hypothetical protein